MIGTILAERGWLPDWLVRTGIRRQLAARLRQQEGLAPEGGARAEFLEQLRHGPLAVCTRDANVQHYEVPAEFFEAVLGPRLKYSCCQYGDGATTLAAAEDAMLRLTCERAELEDGMDVLDLGCGWGSLTLWVAEHFPRSTVTAVSNSAGQRRFIAARARSRGLDNVRVLTANLAGLTEVGRFDRIVSVEMFEHMRNYQALLATLAGWLQPGGKLFVHYFCHRERCYLFEDSGGDWMARHFFTGGLMPSFDLLRHFDRDLVVRNWWRVDGRHYARTCEDWLRNLDAHRAYLLGVLRPGHGAQAAVALQRWRMFLMACAELFAWRGGAEWFVGHYLLEPCAASTHGEQRTEVPQWTWPS